MNASPRHAATASLQILVPVLLSVLLGACGGGSDPAPTPSPTPPPPPVAAAPTTVISATPSSLQPGGTTTLTWSSSNATACSASGAWTGAKAVSGSETSASLAATSSFTLACSGAGGTATQSVTVTVVAPVPVLVFSAAPASVTAGQATTLTWSSTNATTCTASGAWSGSRATSGSATSDPLTASSAFVLNCAGPGGSVQQTVNVSVQAALPPAPTLQFSAAPLTVAPGATSTLTWSSSNATNCAAAGAWSGARGTSGTEVTTALNATSTFALACTGAGGTISRSVTVTVQGPPPTVAISANPNLIAAGSTSTLTWSSTNATSCSALGAWTGPKATTGSEVSAPITATTTFLLSCSGSGGSASAVATVTVATAPVVVITSDRAGLVAGAKATLSYRYGNAASCAATGDLTLQVSAPGGTAERIGTVQVGPITRDSVYGIECTGPGGTTRGSVPISFVTEVRPAPAAVDDRFEYPADTGLIDILYADLLKNDSVSAGSVGPIYYTEWELTGGIGLVELVYCCSTSPSTDSLSFIVKPAVSGTITLRYRFQDDVGNKSNYGTITVVITPVDHQPTAVNDVAGGIRNLALSIDVLANDLRLDPPITLQVTGNASHGNAVVSPNAGSPLIVYTPATDYEGTDAIAYRLTDTQGDVAEASVAITVGPEFRTSPARRFVRLGVAEPWAWTCQGASTVARQWSNKLYTRYKDSFDFIVVLAPSSLTCSPGIAGQHVAAKNDVAGIGQAQFDSTALFGSAGRLRGVLWFPSADSLLNGPALHEIAHNWANFISTSDVPGLGPHWGFSSGGQLGGFDPQTFTDLGGGQYRATNGNPSATGFGLNANGGNSIPYGELELYLMGLRAPAGVPDLIMARGGAFVSGSPGVFTATSIERMTIQDIIAQRGARVPDFTTAPKQFRVLTVVVANKELSDAVVTYVDNSIAQFARPGADSDTRYNFWEATKGVGTLLMDDIDAELK
jgi:plastocyanin